jgi:hypothetical protein
MNNISAGRLFDAIGLLSDETIIQAKEHLQMKTILSSKSEITVPVGQNNAAQIKRMKLPAVQYAGIAAAAVVFVTGTVLMFHMLRRPETEPAGFPGKCVVTETQSAVNTTVLPINTTEPIITPHAPISTYPPPITSTASESVTASPAEITTAPPIITTSPPITTTVPYVTTALPIITTSPPITTTTPSVTTVPPQPAICAENNVFRNCGICAHCFTVRQLDVLTNSEEYRALDCANKKSVLVNLISGWQAQGRINDVEFINPNSFTQAEFKFGYPNDSGFTAQIRLGAFITSCNHIDCEVC